LRERRKSCRRLRTAVRLRGHQYADAEGRFRLETAVPGGYSGAIAAFMHTHDGHEIVTRVVPGEE